MKKKVLKYLLSEQDFDCSFDNIKDKIDVNNIVIKERKKLKLFPSFKILKPLFFSLAIIVVILCSSQLTYFTLRENGDVGFETIQENYDYDNYDDFYKKYLSYYSYCEDIGEFKTINFDLGDNVNYTYQIRVSAKYNYKHKIVDIQSINLNVKIGFDNDDYHIIFKKTIDNYENVYWKKYDNNLYTKYELQKKDNNNVLISLVSFDETSPNLSLLKDYIFEEIKK